MFVFAVQVQLSSRRVGPFVRIRQESVVTILGSGDCSSVRGTYCAAPL